MVITRGPGAGASFPISAPRTTIGRDRACDIVIDDVTVSRFHAELRRRDGGYVLEDGGSLNGTYLNRQPVQRAELADGDEVWAGTARFTFRTGGR
jgi:pSer/pThr/pTyr-binding forkhead associated (FHA) protein